MTALALTLISVGAALVWAGATDTNLWQELVAIFATPTTPTTPINTTIQKD